MAQTEKKFQMREFDAMLHDIVTVAYVLKSLEHSLTEGQCKFLDGCIIRLHEIRQKLLELLPADDTDKEGKNTHGPNFSTLELDNHT